MVRSLKWAAVDNLKKRKTESYDKKWIRSSRLVEAKVKKCLKRRLLRCLLLT